jgi:hypothetical protein
MNRFSARVAFAVMRAGALLAATQAPAAPIVVDYNIAATGQSVTATFDFLTASRLQILLSETTPAAASSLTGGDAILTSLGFALPRVNIAGGSVSIGPGSVTAGFPGHDVAQGADLSNLWGYTPGTLNAALQEASIEFLLGVNAHLQRADQQDQLAAMKAALAKAKRDAAAQLLGNNPDPQQKADAADLIKSAEQDEAAAATARAERDSAAAQAAALQLQADELAARALTAPPFHLVGVLATPLTAFLAAPLGDGLDGGLLGDALARGGELVVSNSVVLSLNLTDALTAAEQEEFFAGLPTKSSIGYGRGGLLGGQPNVPPPTTVSEPSMAALALTTLLALGLLMGRRRARAA